jgi:ArsR family transcriptional regulator
METVSCASKLRVLGDPTRLGVLEMLMQCPLSVTELTERLKVEQSLMSHHLRVLRDAGLVEGRKDGRAVRYRLTPSCETRADAIDLGCCRLWFGEAEPASRASRARSARRTTARSRR